MINNNRAQSVLLRHIFIYDTLGLPGLVDCGWLFEQIFLARKPDVNLFSENFDPGLGILSHVL